MRRVRRPSSASQASTERGSSAQRRHALVDQVQLHHVRRLREGRAAAAASPWRISAAMLSGASSHSAATPRVDGLAHVDHVRQFLVLHPAPPRRHRAPAAASRPPPPRRPRRRSARGRCASTGRGGDAPGAPPARLKASLTGIGFTPACRRSAPVTTSSDAGHAAARGRVDGRRCAHADRASARRPRAAGPSGCEVVGVAAQALAAGPRPRCAARRGRCRSGRRCQGSRDRRSWAPRCGCDRLCRPRGAASARSRGRRQQPLAAIQRSRSSHICRISASSGVRSALGSSMVTTGTPLCTPP